MNRESIKNEIREQCKKLLSDMEDKNNWITNNREIVEINREEKSDNDSKL